MGVINKMERYTVHLEEKLNLISITAKNKSDARKKVNKKLDEQKAKKYVKIYAVEESIF